MGPAIRTTGLTKLYRGGRGIEDLDLAVEPGEIFGFLGPNGAGKTTTIRALVGLARPTRGRARVLGRDPWSDRVELNSRVGYLPGDVALFGRLTGRQHLDRFVRARGGGPPGGLDGLVARLDVVVDRLARDLSRGNRQKLGLVLALMHRPEVLVLDEPTSGLDPLAQDAFYALLREMAAEGTTVFLSSHELGEVQRIADRVAIVRDGRLVVTDTVERMQARARRTVELGTGADPRRLQGVAGVRNLRVEGDRVSLELEGPVAPLLRALARMQPTDLVVGPARLEDLFLRYYREDVADRVG